MYHKPEWYIADTSILHSDKQLQTQRCVILFQQNCIICIYDNNTKLENWVPLLIHICCLFGYLSCSNVADWLIGWLIGQVNGWTGGWLVGCYIRRDNRSTTLYLPILQVTPKRLSILHLQNESDKTRLNLEHAHIRVLKNHWSSIV